MPVGLIALLGECLSHERVVSGNVHVVGVQSDDQHVVVDEPVVAARVARVRGATVRLVEARHKEVRAVGS